MGYDKNTGIGLFNISLDSQDNSLLIEDMDNDNLNEVFLLGYEMEELIKFYIENKGE